MRLQLYVGGCAAEGRSLLERDTLATDVANKLKKRRIVSSYSTLR